MSKRLWFCKEIRVFFKSIGFYNMIFAIGFLLLFTLDILLFFRFRFFGMIPLYFVKAAVGYFTGFMLWRGRRSFSEKWRGTLIYFWIFYLFLVLTIELGVECILYYGGLERGGEGVSQLLRFIEKIQWIEFFLTIVLLSVTLNYGVKKYKDFFFWPLFTLIAILFRNILILFWNPMPVFLYQYFGLVELPGMFGLLMIIVSMVREVYGFQEEINYEK